MKHHLLIVLALVGCLPSLWAAPEANRIVSSLAFPPRAIMDKEAFSGIKRYDAVYNNQGISSTSFSAPGATASIFLGNDGIFDRPVIIIEGYDPYNAEDFSTYWDNYNLSYLGEELLAQGKDLVFVNFQNGGVSLHSNSLYVETLLVYLGQELGANRNNMQVIGFSMGGVIARMALVNLERKNVEHNTATYISYDAPHQGANAPIDIIQQVNRIENKVDITGCGAISKCRSVRSQLRNAQVLWTSAAAREMLNSSPQSEPFYRQLNAMGYPTKPRLVGFANGSGEGMGQANLFDGKSILHYTVDYKGIIQGNNETYRTRSRSLNNDYKSFFRYNDYYIDGAPGGRSASFGTFYDKINGVSKVTVHSFSGDRTMSFVPTVSALDFYTKDLYAKAGEQYTPFDKIYHGGYNNYLHTSFLQHRYQLMNELNGATDVDPVINRPPTAVNDRVQSKPLSRVNLNLVLNDIDLDGDTLSVVSHTQPWNATVTLINSTTVQIDLGRIVGISHFYYTMTDSSGAEATARVEVEVGRVIVPCGPTTCYIEP